MVDAFSHLQSQAQIEAQKILLYAERFSAATKAAGGDVTKVFMYVKNNELHFEPKTKWTNIKQLFLGGRHNIEKQVAEHLHGKLQVLNRANTSQILDLFRPFIRSPVGTEARTTEDKNAEQLLDRVKAFIQNVDTLSGTYGAELKEKIEAQAQSKLINPFKLMETSKKIDDLHNLISQIQSTMGSTSSQVQEVQKEAVSTPISSTAALKFEERELKAADTHMQKINTAAKNLSVSLAELQNTLRKEQEAVKWPDYIKEEMGAAEIEFTKGITTLQEEVKTLQQQAVTLRENFAKTGKIDNAKLIEIEKRLQTMLGKAIEGFVDKVGEHSFNYQDNSLLQKLHNPQSKGDIITGFTELRKLLLAQKAERLAHLQQLQILREKNKQAFRISVDLEVLGIGAFKFSQPPAFQEAAKKLQEGVDRFRDKVGNLQKELESSKLPEEEFAKKMEILNKESEELTVPIEMLIKESLAARIIAHPPRAQAFSPQQLGIMENIQTLKETKVGSAAFNNALSKLLSDDQKQALETLGKSMVGDEAFREALSKLMPKVGE